MINLICNKLPVILVMAWFLGGCTTLEDSTTRNMRAYAYCQDGSHCECTGYIVKDLAEEKVDSPIGGK